MKSKNPFKIGKLLFRSLIIEMHLNNIFEPGCGWDYMKTLSDEKDIKKDSKSYKIAINHLEEEGIWITPFVKEVVFTYLNALKSNLEITKRKLEGKDY